MDEELISLCQAFNIEIDELTKSFTIWRFNTLHVRGVDQLTSEDIYNYFGPIHPHSVEWLSNISCNVTFETVAKAVNALQATATALVVHKNNFTGDDSATTIGGGSGMPLDLKIRSSDSLEIPVPPNYRYILGSEHAKAKSIIIRFATVNDKKVTITSNHSIPLTTPSSTSSLHQQQSYRVPAQINNNNNNRKSRNILDRLNIGTIQRVANNNNNTTRSVPHPLDPISSLNNGDEDIMNDDELMMYDDDIGGDEQPYDLERVHQHKQRLALRMRMRADDEEDEQRKSSSSYKRQFRTTIKPSIASRIGGGGGGERNFRTSSSSRYQVPGIIIRNDRFHGGGGGGVPSSVVLKSKKHFWRASSSNNTYYYGNNNNNVSGNNSVSRADVNDLRHKISSRVVAPGGRVIGGRAHMDDPMLRVRVKYDEI